MVDEEATLVPVWTLGTDRVEDLPALPEGDALTPERLSDLRSVLAAFASKPVVTLEAHPMPKSLDRSRGIALDSMSPLAQELTKLVSQSAKSPAVANAGAQGEILYRMVVPAKVAAQVSSGVVKPMTSKAVAGGIHSALRGSSSVVANATFVPVSAQTASAGAVGGAVGTAAAGAATAGALTVAAPLVLMAVAVGVSAYAEKQRREAVEHMTELLEKLDADSLAKERRELDGCRDAIDKATTILLDEGQIGASLGLDSAVHSINVALSGAQERAEKWAAALDALGDDRVDVSRLVAAFPGLDEDGGEFRAHLELANLAITLKRRVIVLQAVDHGQSGASNVFENFARRLHADQKSIDELERTISSVLLRLSTMEIRSPRRRLDSLMTRGQVDELLETTYRLRDLGTRVHVANSKDDVVIQIAKHRDGSLLVLPAEVE